MCPSPTCKTQSTNADRASGLAFLVVNRAASSISLAFFLMMAGANLPTAFYETYTARFGLSPVTVSGLYSVYALVVIICLPIFGWLSDRFGRRIVLAAGMAVMAMAAIAFVIAGDVGMLYAGRVLQGVSVGLISGTGTAALAELLGDRARAAFMATAATVSGGALGPLLGALLSQLGFWPDELPFLLLSVSSIALSISILIFVPHGNHTSSRVDLDRDRVFGVVRSAVFLESCAAGLFAFAIPGIFMSLGPGYVSSVIGFHGPVVGGCLAFVLMGSSALAQLAVRRNRIGDPTCAGVLLLTAGLALFVSGIHSHALPLIAASAIIAGAGNGLAFTGCVATINRIAPANERGLVSSVLYVAIYIGGGGGALALGITAGSFGMRPALDGFAVASTVIGLGIALPLLRRLVVNTSLFGKASL